jgi:YHS domain-containing protein
MHLLRHMRVRNGFFAAVLGGSVLLFACYGEAFANGEAQKEKASQPVIVSQVISDAHTGLALFGYDVVAYHTDAKPIEGRADYIVLHQNLVWRFASAANRDAFQADPEAFIPAFGGHDARSVGEGRMTMGDPGFFLISKGALVLFRSEENRQHFAAEPEAYKNALKRWPEVMHHYAFH